ncbi:MAG: hypothetical protein AAGU27_07440 [Dehalobacterium sp.]
MSITIYTATGCARCKIVKGFMDENNIQYLEKNMKEEGKEDFQNFYKVNRAAIFRGPDGIEFPIITDSVEIRQSIGASIAYLLGGKKLDGFFNVGTLHQEWVDGIHISEGNPNYQEEFIQVLRYLKSKNMKLQMDTDGRNSVVLEQVLNEKLADVMIMNVLGPQELYQKLLGKDVDLEDVAKSICLIPQFPEYKFQTAIIPVERENGEVSFITPEEIGKTAQFIKEETGSNKNRFFIKRINPKDIKGDAFKYLEPIPDGQLFAYRTKARVHQVFAEIEK